MITLQNKHKRILKLIIFLQFQGIAFLQKLDGLTKLHTVQMEGNPVWSSGEYAYHLVTCLPALQVRRGSCWHCLEKFYIIVVFVHEPAAKTVETWLEYHGTTSKRIQIH